MADGDNSGRPALWAVSARAESRDLLAAAEKVADEISSAFIGKRGVVGIVYLGALARGYFDEYSDIDIVVYKRKGARLGWPRELEYTYSGFTIDLELRDYEKELRRSWGLEERWVFLHARIHYDPFGLVRELLELKVPLTYRERAELLRDELRKAEWSLGDAHAWLQRGDLSSAHFMVSTALRHALRAIVLFNGQPPPPDKWLFRAALASDKRPPKLRDLLEKALLTPELSSTELQRRVSAVDELAGWLRAQLGFSGQQASGDAHL